MNNNGSLIYSFMLILVLSALSAAILLRSTNENSLAKRVTSSSAALWSAEAGTQQALWEYNYNNCHGMVQQGTNTACSSCSSCGGGNKTLAGTLTGYGDYDIILNNASTIAQSVGSVPSRSASNKVLRNVQVTIGRPSIFSYGIFAQGQVTLKQNSLVDAYNSSNGAYGGANIDHTNGNVGSNGTGAGIVEVNNNANVWGNVSTGPGGTVSGSGNIHGSTTHNSSVALPAVVVPSTLTSLSSSGAITIGNNGSQTINAGDYKYSNISMGNQSTLTVNGNVRLYLTGNASQTSLNTGTAHVTVNISNGASLVIYTDGIVTFNNNTTINCVSQLPSNLLIYSTYSGANGVTINNNGTTYGAVYAPQTDVDISNNAGFFGAAVGNTVKLENNGDVHFDTALASMANPFENAIVSNWQEY